jgi:hypothetical protein
LKGIIYGLALAVGALCLAEAADFHWGWWGLGLGFALGMFGQWMARVENR